MQNADMKWLKVQIELVGCIWDGSGERERERERDRGQLLISKRIEKSQKVKLCYKVYAALMISTYAALMIFNTSLVVS